MRVAIAILNWNGISFLEKFLPKVMEHSKNVADVYVIDNDSSDNSVAFVSERFPSVKTILNNKNYGFAKGYNEGLKRIQADYYVLLNSDVEVTVNWIQPIIALMDADARIAACQPKLLNYHVRDEFEYAGGGGGFIDKWGYPFCRGRMFNVFEKDTGQYNDTREIFWASGAALFVRSSAFMEIGGLDEDFFAHMEEIDLCWRLRNSGYKIMYCPNSVIYHVGAGTLAKMNPRKTYYNFRNNLSLICKNHAPEYFYIKLFLRMCMDGLAGIRFLLSGEFAHFFAILRAHFAFYALLPTMMKKRKQIRMQTKHYTKNNIYKGSVVWQFFVKGKKKYSDLEESLF